MPAGILENAPAKNNADFVKCNGKLRVEGVQLVNTHGQAIQLMGMSSHGLHWFPSCYTKESIQYLVENWGINVFRAALYIGEGGYAQQRDLKERVHDIVGWCKDLGIYVIIDWHVLTPGDPNDGVYSEAIPFFEEMALAYRDEDHVLFEICNEPNNVQWSRVKFYADRLIGAIRKIDSKTVILVGTPTWSQDIHEARKDPVARPENVMYAFHFYAGSHMSLLGRVRDEAKLIPIFATEWGTSDYTGDGGPYLADAKKFLDLFSDASGQKISWAQWSYADKPEKSAALRDGACASKSWDSTSCSGSFLKNYIKMHAPTCPGGSSLPQVASRAQPAAAKVEKHRFTQHENTVFNVDAEAREFVIGTEGSREVRPAAIRKRKLG
jgi:aryl-phospho-beta-D-glucosidase BglC (GH1 family)